MLAPAVQIHVPSKCMPNGLVVGVWCLLVMPMTLALRFDILRLTKKPVADDEENTTRNIQACPTKILGLS